MNMHVDPGKQPRKPRTTGSRALQPMDRVRLALKAANDDKEVAFAELIRAATTSITLAKFFIEKGVRAAIGESIRTDNARIFNDDPQADVTAPRALVMKEPPLVSPGHRRRLAATAKTLELLSIRLPNGVTLAHARRADLAHAANHYEKQGRDMLHKAAFYARIERQIGDGKVGDKMDNAALTVMYEESRLKDAP